MERKRIAITMGDPAGIGPEIVVKALTERSVYERCIPVVIGDYEALKDAVRFSGISSVLREIPWRRQWENLGRLNILT